MYENYYLIIYKESSDYLNYANSPRSFRFYIGIEN